MTRKVLVCILVCLVLALIMPVLFSEVYIPKEHQTNDIESVGMLIDKAQLPEMKQAGFLDKINFIISDKLAFKQYLKQVLQFFLMMFLAALMSVLVNEKFDQSNH